MQIRFQFKRGNDLKFIGHLDILRLFERAFKRSRLPVAYSQGFNPRPQIVFGQPMPLGLTSDGEFADVDLASSIDPGEFMITMNTALPPGIQLVDIREIRNPANLMGLITGARYRICFEMPENMEIQKIIRDVLDSETINVMKKTKSGEKEKNIRPFIYELSGDNDGTLACFDVLLGAGQDDNIRAELLMAGVSGVCHVKLELQSMHRVLLLGRKEGKWLSLLDDRML